MGRLPAVDEAEEPAEDSTHTPVRARRASTGFSGYDGDVNEPAVTTAPKRRATPPLWFLVAAALTILIVLLHTRAYVAWYLFEPLVIGGIALTSIGFVMWILRAFECDRHGLALVLASSAVGLVGAYLGAGGRIYYLFAAAACIFVLPLVTVLALIYRAMKKPRLARGFAAAAIACLVQVAAAFGSNVLRQHDVAAAMAWCDELRPRIEAFYAKHHYWPVDLETDQIVEGGWRPRLLRGVEFYKARGDKVELFIRCRRPSIPSRQIKPIRWTWSNETRVWKWAWE